MAITSTTLSAAIGANDTVFQVASGTGINAPNFTTGLNVTYLQVEQEMMIVTAVSGTFISVIRGQLGSQAVAHAITAPVNAGLYSDFPLFQPTVTAFNADYNRYSGVSAPVASAATIVATGRTFHVTGTTATNIITPYTNFSEGRITIIADGVWTWTASTTATNGIAATGTVTTAKSAVDFVYDLATLLWYPTRLA